MKKLSLSIVYNKCGHAYEKIFRKEESIEILKIFGLINNIKEHNRIYNHVWRKCNKKLLKKNKHELMSEKCKNICIVLNYIE